MFSSKSTPSELWEDVNKTFVLGGPEVVKVSGSSAHMTEPSIFFIDSFSWEGLGMEKVGCTLTKWNMLRSRYFSKEEFDNMVTRCKYYLEKNGEVTAVAMHFLGSKSRVKVEELDDPRGGPCLLSISLCIPKGGKPNILVTGRSSEATVKFHCDLIFIYRVLEELGRELGFKPEDCSAVWVVHSLFQNLHFSLVYWKNHTVFGMTESPWGKKLYHELKDIIEHGKRSNAKSSRRVIKFLIEDKIYETIDRKELILWQE